MSIIYSFRGSDTSGVADGVSKDFGMPVKKDSYIEMTEDELKLVNRGWKKSIIRAHAEDGKEHVCFPSDTKIRVTINGLECGYLIVGPIEIKRYRELGPQEIIDDGFKIFDDFTNDIGKPKGQRKFPNGADAYISVYKIRIFIENPTKDRAQERHRYPCEDEN